MKERITTVVNNIPIEVYTYSNPELALSEFKPNLYDLLLIDVNTPKMNGFELYTKLLEIDANPRIRFMSSAEVNHQGLRENIFIDKYRRLY